MEKKVDVLCIGAAIVDIPLRPVDKHIFDSQSYPLERIVMTIGGDAINEAVIISRLGYKTALMSKVGNDAAGDFVLKACEREGIDRESICVDDKTDTSINIGLVAEDGERSFITSRNASLWKMNIEDVDFSRFHEARLLSLASIFNNPLLDGKALEKIFLEAKKNHLIICADMIHPRLGETIEDIRTPLQYIDYFFPNYSEAALITGKEDLDAIADTFLDCGVKNVIIKTGKQGCFVKNKRQRLFVPACKGIKVIDTIGAGDNFASGFIASVLEGRTLEECAQIGNVTAGISVQSLGATGGVKSMEQVYEMYRQYQAEQRGE